MRSLSDKEVIEVREFYTSGLYTKKELAEMYKCSPTTIALWLPEKSEYREIKIHSQTFIYYEKGKCRLCEKSLKNHLRCSLCTILLHDKLCNHDKKSI